MTDNVSQTNSTLPRFFSHSNAQTAETTSVPTVAAQEFARQSIPTRNVWKVFTINYVLDVPPKNLLYLLKVMIGQNQVEQT